MLTVRAVCVCLRSKASAENFAPAVLKRLAKEMQDMQREPPEGIKVFVNDDDITDIQAVIAGPGPCGGPQGERRHRRAWLTLRRTTLPWGRSTAQTPYAGGAFRIKLTLSDDFPTTPPKGPFSSRSLRRLSKLC